MIRVGQGIDVHAFDDARPLILGGVRISETGGLAGHSDADAVLHAITDALLGAAGNVAHAVGLHGLVDQHLRDSDNDVPHALVHEKALHYALENRLSAEETELFGDVAPEAGAGTGGGDEHGNGHKSDE